VLVLAGIACVVLIFVYRMPQDPGYHLFADTRTCLGIPNFFNVASNLAFLVVGGAGLLEMSRAAPDHGLRFGARGEVWIFIALFVGTLLVTFGSGYYHLVPNNPRLFWDRMPMAIVGSAFVGAIIADRFGARAGVVALAVLAVVSAGALIYWRSTIGAGPDNVWPYFATVYGSLIFGVVAMLLFPSRYTHAYVTWIAVAIYVVAMAFDTWLDEPLYTVGGILSGHSLKHMLAAVALGCVGWGALRLRRPKNA
jgi:hypothetical protein